MIESSTGVVLSTEDRQRMRRLSEEVRGRLEEMALITARNLGVRLTGDSIRKFVPVAAAVDRAHVTHVEIIDNPDGTHGCYTEFDDGSAICEPC
jgi:hypothetical protein